MKAIQHIIDHVNELLQVSLSLDHSRLAWHALNDACKMHDICMIFISYNKIMSLSLSWHQYMTSVYLPIGNFSCVITIYYTKNTVWERYDNI